MQLDKLINRELDRAFRLVGTMAKDATFHLKTVKGFDYNSRSVVTDDERDVTTKAIILDTKKRESGVVHQQLLVKSAPLKELDLYDKVTVAGHEWLVGTSIADSGSTQLIEISRKL